MPRRPRGSRHDYVYHVLNRGVRRAVLFEASEDYAAFERVMFEAVRRFRLRLLAYSVMPTHWHLVVWPQALGQLSRFMHWMTTTHAQRWHARRGSTGTGAVYQGRYKAIPVQSDRNFLRLCRYVERNALRAGLTERAELWRWSSLWRRCNFCDEGVLDAWPLDRPAEWIEYVNAPQSDKEVAGLRLAIRRNMPLGDCEWTRATALDLGLDPRFRNRGRPESDQHAQG